MMNWKGFGRKQLWPTSWKGLAAGMGWVARSHHQAYGDQSGRAETGNQTRMGWQLGRAKLESRLGLGLGLGFQVILKQSGLGTMPGP
jgi:hypothetical protein